MQERTGGRNTSGNCSQKPSANIFCSTVFVNESSETKNLLLESYFFKFNVFFYNKIPPNDKGFIMKKLSQSILCCAFMHLLVRNECNVSTETQEWFRFYRLNVF